jgi:hypothetical protein
VKTRVATAPAGVSVAQFLGAACLCGVADTLALLMADQASLLAPIVSVAKIGCLIGSLRVDVPSEDRVDARPAEHRPARIPALPRVHEGCVRCRQGRGQRRGGAGSRSKRAPASVDPAADGATIGGGEGTMSDWKIQLRGRCKRCGGAGRVEDPKSGRLLDCHPCDRTGEVHPFVPLAELKAMLDGI